MKTTAARSVIGYGFRYSMRYSIHLFYLLVLECHSMDQRQ